MFLPTNVRGVERAEKPKNVAASGILWQTFFEFVTLRGPCRSSSLLPTLIFLLRDIIGRHFESGQILTGPGLREANDRKIAHIVMQFLRFDFSPGMTKTSRFLKLTCFLIL